VNNGCTRSVLAICRYLGDGTQAGAVAVVGWEIPAVKTFESKVRPCVSDLNCQHQYSFIPNGEPCNVSGAYTSVHRNKPQRA
jgi:hypothetical protein